MFEQIKQTLGNMDGQYQAKTPVKAFITDVKDVEYSQKTGRPGQSLYLRHEETSEIAWVKFVGKGVAENPLDKTDKGTQRDFLIWPFKPDESPKTSLYCWIQRQTSQPTPQAPPQAAQGTKPPQEGNYTQILERIAIALEKITAKSESFEQKYDLNEQGEDTAPF